MWVSFGKGWSPTNGVSVRVVQTQPHHIQHSGHLAHDLRESQFVESLIARRVFFGHWNLDPVLLNDAVERLVIQSVVAGRKWKVCTASP